MKDPEKKPVVIRMVKIVKWLFIVLLFVFINISIHNSGQQEFLGTELPSALVAHDAPKVVNNLERWGNLTFGPYITLNQGTYKITIDYQTDSKENFIDVISGQTKEPYYKEYLAPNKDQTEFKVTLEKPVSGLEIRTFYNGAGSFEVQKISIEKAVGSYQITVNVVLLLLLLFYEVKGKKASYEIKFACVVMLLLSMPLLLGTLSKSTGEKIDLELKGNFDSYTKPEFLLDDFISREYQNGFENWWNENFVSRGYIISAYNQLRYSLFDLGNRIVGKENSIYEEVYLADVLCMTPDKDYSLAENQAAMRRYVEQLERISENLKQLGKEFLVYTTINKAAEQPENIPQRYLLKYQDENKIRAIDYFRSIEDEYNFSYLDTSAFIKALAPDYPVFYKTGIHWSRPAEQEVSRNILQLLKEQSVPVGAFELGTLKESTEPYWRDTDVYDMLNIYNGTMDPVYYEYETSVREEGTANVLIQGGSFAQGFAKDFIENRAGTDIIDIFYDEYVEKSDGTRLPLSSWEDLELASYIEQADAVIIEVNEQVLSRYSDGFVEYLSAFLEQYVAGKEKSDNMVLSGNLAYGFHEWEDGYRWMEGEAKVEFINEKIKSVGLEIELNIPDMLSDDGIVEIAINGISRKTVSLANKGRHTILFSPEELPETDQYEIVISASDTFVPKEEGMNADSRILGIQVFYIGEKR